VQFRDFMDVERYSHVMLLVSTVEGPVARVYGARCPGRAAFPADRLGGTKVRAMEIIDELELTSAALRGATAL
jgi:anthranilate synthase component 1